jgi:HPt (histidine-containing phosphotransfer) domain-containing protein
MIEEPQPAFDADEVCRWYDNDMESIHELIGLVLADLPRYAKGLEDAADGGDLTTVARFAHTIKGAVGNVCALRLCGVAEALELGARDGDTARIAALRGDFRSCTMALVDELSAWVQTIGHSAQTESAGGAV